MLTRLTRIPLRTRRTAVTALLAGLAATAVAAGLGLGNPSGHPRVGTGREGLTGLHVTTAAAGAPPVAVPVLRPGQLDRLPPAITTATLPAAPRDPDPRAGTDGTVVHNTQPMPVFTAPGGTPFARLPTTEVGSDTWLPVIATQPGWVRVLLPSRPNGSTGWLDANGVRQAHTPFLIRVNLGARTLQLLDGGRSAGTWPAGIGKPATPTPAGRTFVLASITDRHQNYSPVILPLGTHSSTLDNFGGGPGTVAIHTWPTADTFGIPSSHGCIRIPGPALRVLQNVPLGTVVLITT